jgi:hypothetical protein
MTSASEPARTETGNRTLANRIIGWDWKWPICLASALLLVLLGVVFGVNSMLGDDPMLQRSRDAFMLGPRLRTHTVLALVSAFTLGAGLTGLAKATHEFDRLRRILRLDDGRFDVYRCRLFPNARVLFIAALIGGFAGTTLILSPRIFSLLRQGYPSAHSFFFMILLFGLMGAFALITYRQSQVFNEVGRQAVEVDLLEPESLSPFAALGLRNAGSWFIGSAIASLLMTGTGNMWIIAVVIVVTLGFGIAALIVPSRGLHAHIQERKREELAVIREAIANERAILFSAPEPSPDPPRMHAMLAYEARIESVREWPFDTSTLSRFGFFLLIPLVSWIGGALVERAVNAALD